MLNLLDIWINEGSGWIIDKIEYKNRYKFYHIYVLCGAVLGLLILQIVTHKE